MTREAKLEAIARSLIDYRVGDCIADTANKILSAVEGDTMKKKPKSKKGGRC